MATFVDQLLNKHKEKYFKSITHPLTNELCTGTLPDYKLFTYLVQDLKYFQIGLNLFGKTLSYCDDANSAIVIGKQIGFISNDENDYFNICLKQIKDEKLPELQEYCSKMLIEQPITLPEVHCYTEFIKYLNFESRSYIELVTFTYAMEQVYLGWADYNLEKGTIPEDLPYKYKEWIILHSGAEFTKWTNFLKAEVNRVVKTEQDKELCEQVLVKALELEISFFEACYTYRE